MRYPQLGRYDDHHLDSMLYSYERLAETHARQGHYALAKWANGMRVHITVEMNKRVAAAQTVEQRTMPLFENTDPR